MSQLLLQLPASVCLYLDHVHVCLSVRLHACLSRPRSTPLYVSVSLYFSFSLCLFILLSICLGLSPISCVSVSSFICLDMSACSSILSIDLCNICCWNCSSVVDQRVLVIDRDVLPLPPLYTCLSAWLGWLFVLVSVFRCLAVTCHPRILLLLDSTQGSDTIYAALISLLIQLPEVYVCLSACLSCLSVCLYACLPIFLCS